MELRRSRADTVDLSAYKDVDNDPVQYLYQFDEFAAWVDGCLEIYRQELSRLLYPVLIHTYLALVRNGLSAESHRLMSKCRRRFTESHHEDISAVARQELQDLSHVSVAQHLATNKTAQAACSNRYPVTLLTATLNLLLHFLHTSRLYLVLAIVNQHVSLKVVDSVVSAADGGAKGSQGSRMVLMTTGQHSLALNNATELHLNLLKGNLEDVYNKVQEEKEAGKEREAEEEVDGKQLTKKEKLARAKDQAAKKDKRKEEYAERMYAQIPIPTLTEEAVAARLSDIEHRAAVAADQLPSCLFCTLVNTAHSLCCVDISADGNVMAGGFSDSSVRLYDFTPASSSIIKKDEGPQDMEVDESTGVSDDECDDGHRAAPRVTVLHGHTAAVYGVSLSEDGMYLVSASGDGTVRLWSPEMKSALVAYRGHGFPVWDVKMCPAGRYFVSGGADRVARLWATEYKQPLRMFAGHTSDVDVVSWHPNMHYIATGSSDHTVRLWDVKQGKSVRVLSGHRAPVTSMAFSPDGRSLASCDAGGALVMWDLGTARQRCRVSAHKGAIWSVAFSQGDGALLASGGADRTLCVWNAQDCTTAAGPGEGKSEVHKKGAVEEQLPLVTRWHTRETPVYAVNFTHRNLMVAAGAMLVRRKRTS